MSPLSWVKISTNLPTKPAVAAIGMKLKEQPFAVCGRLMMVWAWAYPLTKDGFVAHADRSLIDRVAGKRGFAAAMESVHWLEITSDGVIFPHWDRHNSGQAKARAGEAERKRMQRADTPSESCPENRPDTCPDKSQTREEKRREEPPKPPPGACGGEIPHDGDGPIMRLILPEVLANNPPFVATWEGDWLPYQLARNRGRVPTIHTLESHLKTCAKLRPSQAVAALKSAIEKGWAAPDENPKVTLFERPSDEAPDDWKAIWRDEFPPENFPEAPRYEEGEWKAVRNDHKQMIRDLAKKRRRNVA